MEGQKMGAKKGMEREKHKRKGRIVTLAYRLSTMGLTQIRLVGWDGE